MNLLKRFSAPGRLLSLRSKSLQDVRLEEKYQRTYYAVTSNHNLKIPVKFDALNYTHQHFSYYKRTYCDGTYQGKNEICTFEKLDNTFKMQMEMLSEEIPYKLDRDRQAFIKTTNKIMMNVSKFIEKKRLTKVKELLTLDCFAKLEDQIDNWNPKERSGISVTTQDLFWPKLHSFNNGVKKDLSGNKVEIEAQAIYLIVKDYQTDKYDTIRNFISDQKSGILEEKIKEKWFDPRQGMQLSFDPVLDMHAAHYRYIKYKNSDQWIVSGLHHFRLIDRPIILMEVVI